MILLLISCFLYFGLLPSSLLSQVSALHDTDVYTCRIPISGQMNKQRASATEMVVSGSVPV